jgi:nucleoid-associated protein YgaU
MLPRTVRALMLTAASASIALSSSSADAATVATTVTIAVSSPAGVTSAGIPMAGPTPIAPALSWPADEVRSGAAHGGASDDDIVVVRSGDSLWVLAAHRLGATPTDDQIARAWPRWYAANQQVIGSDPNLLLPGTLLTIPTDGA